MNELDNVPLNRGGWAFTDVIGERKEWGPFVKPITVTVAAYNVSPLERTLIADCTANAVTFTLETAIGCAGRRHTFKKIDAVANAMTIDGFGSETIDGAASINTVTQYEVFRLESTGSGWIKV